jgi:hypothetical protein
MRWRQFSCKWQKSWGGLGAWLAFQQVALAQQAAAPEKVSPAPSDAYVIPSLLVIVCVAAGLLAICRPGRRRDRADSSENMKSDAM